MENPQDQDAKPVEGELVDGIAKADAPEPGRKTFFHPASGLAILAVDWLAFGADLFSGLALMAAASLAAFAVTFYLVRAIQLRYGGDTGQAAAFKAFLGALAAGVPFPIGGTIMGAAIILLSGLPGPGRRRG